MEDILGHLELDNNTLAKTMREVDSNIHYHGIESFEGVWSSDIRRMIQIFVDMIHELQLDKRSKRSKKKQSLFPISPSVQNRVLMRAGRDFLEFTVQMPNPKYLEMPMPKEDRNEKFGEHMKDIVEAFMKVARNELMMGNLISNEGRFNPKQAFRIEVMDHFHLQDAARPYYQGLVRWHVFLQDRRGKSVRGNFSPRLYMNRVLIPHAKLTFSKHDHIHLSNQQLNQLLIEPVTFFEAYVKKKKAGGDKTSQMKLPFQRNLKKR